jgi:putative nucleotidyltransferase with HDIG domain
MEQKQLEKFKIWFDAYVARFYGEDEFVNSNLKLKEDHSTRVGQEMLYLADELGLEAEQKRIAEAIALFHDIGRFEQFVKYRTYSDVRSTNHCLLGLEVLRKTKVLEEVDEAETELIEKAIEYHGMKELPNGLDDAPLLFSKLIRDADKLDIFYVITNSYKQYKDDPLTFMLELELPDEPSYSSHIVDAILNGQKIDYASLRTANDMKLCQLGWVYDVNFTASLRRIKQRGFLKMIFEFLPKTGDIEKVRKKILGYVDLKIKQAGDEITN